MDSSRECSSACILQLHGTDLFSKTYGCLGILIGLVVTHAVQRCAWVELHHGKVICDVVLHYEILTCYCFNAIMYNAKESGGIITKLPGTQCFL